MEIKKLTIWVFGITLFTALSKFEIYTQPIRNIAMEGYFQPMFLLSNLLSLLFLFFPMLAVYFYKQEKNISYLFLALFVIPAYLFGMTPIPFATNLYTNNTQLNSIFIATVDSIFVIIIWLLYRANKALKQQDAASGAS